MQLGGNYGNLECPSMIELKFFYIHLYKPIIKNVTPQFDPLGENVSFFLFFIIEIQVPEPKNSPWKFHKVPSKKSFFIATLGHFAPMLG